MVIPVVLIATRILLDALRYFSLCSFLSFPLQVFVGITDEIFRCPSQEETAIEIKYGFEIKPPRF